MEEAVNTQFRRTLAFLVAAVVTAAILRHVGHCYAGYSREELREFALFAAPAVMFAFGLFKAAVSMRRGHDQDLW